MKRFIIAVVVFLASMVVMPRVHGYATISLAANDLNYFMETNGVWLLDGDAVFMGQFSVSDTTISGYVSGGTISQANYESLLAAFIPLDSVYSNTIGTGTSIAPADYNSGAIEADFYGANGDFANGKIYVMVFDAASTGAAHSVGVFTGDSSWKYPGDMDGGSATPNTDAASHTPLIGTYVSGIAGSSNGWNSNDGYQNNPIGGLKLIPIEAIPEPSTALLVGVALAGMFAIRRRK